MAKSSLATKRVQRTLFVAQMDLSFASASPKGVDKERGRRIPYSSPQAGLHLKLKQVSGVVPSMTSCHSVSETFLHLVVPTNTDKQFDLFAPYTFSNSINSINSKDLFAPCTFSNKVQ